MLAFFTIVIMMAAAYSYLREGLFTACTMCCNTLLAGVVAFNFFEPLANQIEPTLTGTFLRGFEDFACLVVIFCLVLGLLRTVTNAIANKQVKFPQALHRGGGVVFGLITGYFTSGFLLCALQTLPWNENFMYFDPKYEPGPGQGLRRVLPPDRVWLAMMYRAGAYTFANEEDPKGRGSSSPYEKYYTFDKSATFEYRYAHYRRHTDTREVETYQHQLDDQLHGPR